MGKRTLLQEQSDVSNLAGSRYTVSSGETEMEESFFPVAEEAASCQLHLQEQPKLFPWGCINLSSQQQPMRVPVLSYSVST